MLFYNFKNFCVYHDDNGICAFQNAARIGFPDPDGVCVQNSPTCPVLYQINKNNKKIYQNQSGLSRLLRAGITDAQRAPNRLPDIPRRD